MNANGVQGMSGWGRLRRISSHGGRFGLAALFMLGAILLVQSISADAERGEFGILVRARGIVQYQAAASNVWVRATERMRVNVGDKLNTGPDGSAIVKLSNGNFVSLGASSRITLATATSHSVLDPSHRVLGLFPARTRVQDIEVDLTRGRAVNVLHGLHASSQYRLRTPIATAGVRGTIFYAIVGEPGRGVKQAGGDPGVSFGCLEGSVEITSNEPGTFDPVNINEGQAFSFGTGGGDQGGEPGTGNISPEDAEDANDAVDQVNDVAAGGAEEQRLDDPVNIQGDHSTSNQQQYYY